MRPPDDPARGASGRARSPSWHTHLRRLASQLGGAGRARVAGRLVVDLRTFQFGPRPQCKRARPARCGPRAAAKANRARQFRQSRQVSTNLDKFQQIAKLATMAPPDCFSCPSICAVLLRFIALGCALLGPPGPSGQRPSQTGLAIVGTPLGFFVFALRNRIVVVVVHIGHQLRAGAGAQHPPSPMGQLNFKFSRHQRLS